MPRSAYLRKFLPAEEHSAQVSPDGFTHTLGEICQQPELWEITAHQIGAILVRWHSLLAGVNCIALTGSGSSCYVGECLSYAVQEHTSVTTVARPSGDLLLLRSRALPALRPMVLVSFARSGNSPETSGLIRQLLDTESELVHLVLTCNQSGHVAANWGNGNRDPRVQVVMLDDRTCDRSLVMTSSFTNLAVAGMGLAYVDRPGEYITATRRLAAAGTELLTNWADPLAAVAESGFERMIVLGDGPSHGAAREAALKMLEMTDGRVTTMAETSLGFRHGPMCALRRNALLVIFLASDRLHRAYQIDLLDEIRKKGLGGRKVIVGSDIPSAVVAENDLAVDLPQLRELTDDWASIVDVVVGQLLGFFRCRAEGLEPDQPAVTGAISRVVGEFPLHGIPSKVRR